MNSKRPHGSDLVSIEHQIRRLTPQSDEQGRLVDQMLDLIQYERRGRA